MYELIAILIYLLIGWVISYRSHRLRLRRMPMKPIAYQLGEYYYKDEDRYASGQCFTPYNSWLQIQEDMIFWYGSVAILWVLYRGYFVNN